MTERIREHESKLGHPAQRRWLKHHEKELRIFREQFKLAEKETRKREIQGSIYIFAEDITEEEAEKRTNCWLTGLIHF